MYSLLKSLTDPVVIILLIMSTGIWMLKDIRKDNTGRLGWRILLFSVLIIYTLSISAVVLPMAYALEKEFYLQESSRTREVDVIVVLGGGLRRWPIFQRDPSIETSDRLLSGIQYLIQTNAKHIVLSGGGIQHNSEAEVMARVAENLGIDKSKIIIESNSHNTWEHAVELNKLIANKDMPIGVVTSAIHMKRSLMVFEKYFPEVVPLPSGYIYSQKKYYVKSFLPNSHSLYMSSKILNEFFGLFWYQIKSWI
jgi:uncharacterized SAM-binding protein YcdF (DUF218 family)